MSEKLHDITVWTDWLWLATVQQTQKSAEEIRQSLTIIRNERTWEVPEENLFDAIYWAYIINGTYKLHEKSLFQDHWWIDVAYDKAISEPEKIIIVFMITSNMLEYLKRKWWIQKAKIEFLENHHNCLFIEAGTTQFSKEYICNALQKKKENTFVKLNALTIINHHQIWSIKHDLGHIKDPYNPVNEYEKWELQKARITTQELFPWLNTLEKMLDFIVHIKLDIPELMKWQRIEWVYCDIDGTLIDYVGIHSWKEGTQQLRTRVVELLKKYESEWKEIILWTWWDVQQKEAYLRSLWIRRPVKSKYDYAWATAEIVVDDTDQNAFIAQSKIYPETYIDTREW